MTKLSRRNFLKAGGGSAVLAGATIAGGTLVPTAASAANTSGTLPYDEKAVVMGSKLKTGVPVSFTYPDSSSPCMVIKTGSPAPGGVGPDKDIVAFSSLCTHMGCPVNYDAASAKFKCPCHYSQFDPEKGGQMICGQATVDLPQIELRYHASSDGVTAVGVNGLIYGRQANVLS